MNPEILANLRNVLVTLYTDETGIQRVMADAGLTSARVKLNVALVDLWHSVLTEAVKLERIEALLVVVEHDYGDNSLLRQACVACRQATDDMRRSSPTPVAWVDEQNARVDQLLVGRPAPHLLRQPGRSYPPLINHDDAIALFSELLQPTPRRRFMRLLGEGEMGKTTLLREVFPVLADQQGLRTAFIDMRNQAQKPLDFLHMICGQINRQGFPSFDKAYDQWLTRPKVQISGLQALFSKIQVGSREDDEGSADPILLLTRRFVDDLDQLNAHTTLLLFDAVDNASPFTQSWLMDQLLVQLQSLPHARAVVGGRTLPDASGAYARHCCSYELRPVQDTAAYVRYCRELGLNLSEELIRTGAIFCSFNPGRFANAIKVHFASASVTHG